MRHDDIPDDLKRLAFDFFYWFSRFEFALKEARCLKSTEEGAKAEVSWDLFIEKQRNAYQLNAVGRALIDAKPQRQIVGANGLNFRDVGFNTGVSDLERVVRLANTVRNNLFHGAKWAYELRGQRDNFTHANCILMRMLDRHGQLG